MDDKAAGWFFQFTLLGSGIVYARMIERKPENRKKVLLNVVFFFLFCSAVIHLSVYETLLTELFSRTAAFLFLVHLLYIGKQVTVQTAVYYAVWAFCTWQLLYEACIISRNLGADFWINKRLLLGISDLLIFAAGYLFVGLVTGKIITDYGHKKIGSRQLGLALITFVIFQTMVFVPENMEAVFQSQRWLNIYITQILLGVVLYLQNELFVKSELRKELEIMGLLWKKEKEQYQLSKENIALLSQNIHDLKHQVHAIRNASKEDLDQYLEEIEGRIQTYEAIVKTGCAALDTILTEKSLYCKDHDITISCMADGRQMDFLNTVDLYAILGNALDNAIEEVDKFLEKDRRQIDVLICRRQQFLAIEITNPMEGKLVYEDELPVTTKGSRRIHGFGLKSIRYMLDKYNGFFTIKEDGRCFSLLMLIPVPRTAATYDEKTTT